MQPQVTVHQEFTLVTQEGSPTIREAILGDGSRIRGVRADCVMIDEMADMPGGEALATLMAALRTIDNGRRITSV